MIFERFRIIFPNDRPCKELGSVFLEFAIAMPVLLLVIWGTIYFGMSLAVQGMADDAANLALTKAVTERVFQEPTDCPEEDSDFCDAIDEVVGEARSRALILIGESSGSNFAYLAEDPRLILPQPGDGESVLEAYSREPFRVEIPVTVTPLVPVPGFPSFSLLGVAEGYYEGNLGATFPGAVDCNGYSYMHSQYQTEACDCGDTAHWDWQLGTCLECESGDQRGVYDSEHSSGSQDPDTGCYCPTTDWCETNYGTPDVRSHGCECKCDGGMTGSPTEGCTCAAEPCSFDGSNCWWPDSGNPIHDFYANGNEYREYDSGTCKCVPALSDADCNAAYDVQIAGTQIDLTAWSTGCGCSCDIQAYCDAAPGGASRKHWWNPNSCSCKCDFHETMEFDDVAGACVCKVGFRPEDAQGIAVHNPVDCTFSCPNDCGLGDEPVPDDGCLCHGCDNPPGDPYSCTDPGGDQGGG